MHQVRLHPNFWLPEAILSSQWYVDPSGAYFLSPFEGRRNVIAVIVSILGNYTHIFGV